MQRWDLMHAQWVLQDFSIYTCNDRVRHLGMEIRPEKAPLQIMSPQLLPYLWDLHHASHDDEALISQTHFISESLMIRTASTAGIICHACENINFIGGTMDCQWPVARPIADVTA